MKLFEAGQALHVLPPRSEATVPVPKNLCKSQWVESDATALGRCGYFLEYIVIPWQFCEGGSWNSLTHTLQFLQ